MKRLSFKSFAIAAALVLAPIAVAVFAPLPALSQGFPFVSPFAGVQPQNTVDFTNPPISISPQGALVGQASPVQSVPIGSVAYASFGTATTYAASTSMYCTSILVPFNMTVTNINVLAGGTVGTNAIIGSLHNTAGTRIGNSALAGTATAGANTLQVLALTAPLAIQGPSLYYVCIQANGTTDNVRTVAASTFVGVRGSVQTGSAFGTVLSPIVVPAAFNANTGPIVYLN